MELIDWLCDDCYGEEACAEALEWLAGLPLDDLSPERVWELCPRGDWLLWWHERAGTPDEDVVEVARRAAERAKQYAEQADIQEARFEARLASSVVSDGAPWSVWEALVASSLAAAYCSGRESKDAEYAKSAADCRELLTVPNWEP